MPYESPSSAKPDWGHALAANGLELSRETRVRRGLRASIIRVVGVRTWLIPMGLRWLIARSGVGKPKLRQLCRRMQTFADWTSVWEHEASVEESAGNVERAGVYLHWAQYVLFPSDPRKAQLRERASALYLAREDVINAHTLVVTHRGYTATALVQLPEGPPPPGLAVVIPGLFDARERNHSLATSLLEAGVAVCRFELADSTMMTEIEPEGLIEILPRTIEAAAAHTGVPVERVDLFGLCLGGFYAFHAASQLPIRSLTTVSGVGDASSYASRIPGNAFESVLSRKVLEATADPLALVARGAVDLVAEQISCRVTMHHGARDVMVPVADAMRISRLISGPTDLRVHLLDGHGCPKNFRQAAGGFVANCPQLEEETSPIRHAA